MDQIMNLTFEQIKKLSMENSERRQELLDSIRGMHGDQAAAVAMAVAEIHIMMTLIERMVMADNAHDTDPDRAVVRVASCRIMRMAILERTIMPLLEATTVPDEALEDYSKITQKLVETLHDSLRHI